MANPIDHIEITNFKSIRHLNIEGCKRINVFIGYPNVGKSAILEAIAALGYLQKDFSEPYSKLCRLKYPNELFYDGNINDAISVSYSENAKVNFIYLTENEIELSLLLKNTEAERKVNSEEWHPYKKIKFNRDSVAGYNNNAAKDIIKVKKYTFQNEFHNFKTNGLTLDFPEGKNLVDIVQHNKELRKEVIELFKASGLKLNIDLGNNSIRGFKQLDDELVFTIPFYQMADTLQRLVFHKAAIKSNENSVLLFEEPEAHMFPPYIRKFTGDVIYDTNQNQFFIATHSPFVLDDFIEEVRDELSVFLVSLKDGATVIKRLSDEELERVHKYHVDLFFNMESYID